MNKSAIKIPPTLDLPKAFDPVVQGPKACSVASADWYGGVFEYGSPNSPYKNTLVYLCIKLIKIESK